MVGTGGTRMQPPVNQSLESFNCTPLLRIKTLHATSNPSAWGTIATCWKLLTERGSYRLENAVGQNFRFVISWQSCLWETIKKEKKKECRAKKREGKASQAKPTTKGLETTSLRLLHFPSQMRHREDLSLADRDKSYRCLASCLCTTVYFFNEVWDQNSINSHSSRSRQELVSGAIQGAQHHSLRIREVHSWLKIGLERSHF